MKILLIGGAGFIGKHLIKFLSKNYAAEITVVDKFSLNVHPSSKEFSYFIDKYRISLIRGAIEDENVQQNLKNQKFNTVYFLAANTSTGKSMKNPQEHVRDSLLSLSSFLEFAGDSKNRFEFEKIMLTSSRAVYGQGAWVDIAGKIHYPMDRKISDLESGEFNLAGEINNPLAFLANDHSHMANPCNTYGSIKLAQEKILNFWSNDMSDRSMIFRLQNVIGPLQSPQNSYSGVITKFFVDAIKYKHINVFEDGQIVRDFIDVRDVVKLMDHFSKKFISHPIDLGRSEPLTLFAIAKKISSITGAKINISGEYRIGDVRKAYSSGNALEEIKNEFHFTELDESLSDIYEYVLANVK